MSEEQQRPDENLNAIRPPETAPSERPDQATAVGERLNAKKPLTPTEVAAQSHQAHLDTLQGHIDHHLSCCEKLEKKLESLLLKCDEFQGRLLVDQMKAGSLISRCTRLETSSESLGCFNILIGILIAVAGGAFGFGGTAPNVSEEEKRWCTAIGSTATAVGILLTLAAFALRLYSKPRGKVEKM